MKRILVLSLFLALCFAGCVQPTPTPVDNGNACDAGELTKPLIDSPSNILVDTNTPTLSWAYPGGCQPEYFRVEVQDYSGSMLYDQDLPGSQLSWATTTPLQPSAIYQWRVAAVQGATPGPYSHWVTFWVGPLCEAAVWTAPQLISPAQGEVVTTASPELHWQYDSSTCLMPASRFEVSELPDFSALALHGQGGGPEPWFSTGLSYLQDCKTYYWRAAPWQDGQTGPYAEPVQFTTQFGTSCAVATEEVGECPLKPLPGQPKLLGVSCRSETKLTVSFEFQAPVSGNYLATVNNEPYTCEVLPKFPDRLYCSGPGKQNTQLAIKLIDADTGKVIFCKTESAPICQPTAVPPSGCVIRTQQYCRDLLKDPSAEFDVKNCKCIIVN